MDDLAAEIARGLRRRRADPGDDFRGLTNREVIEVAADTTAIFARWLDRRLSALEREVCGLLPEDRRRAIEDARTAAEAELDAETGQRS